MASYNLIDLRQCNPGFKSWEEPKDSAISELAFIVMRNYWNRKRKKRPAAVVDWKVVVEKLSGKKSG